MSHHIKLLFAICAFTFGGINNSDNNQKNEITKVSFSRFGSPYIAIEIDSAMNYKYFGSLNARTKGFYTGKLSEADWIHLKALLEKVDYKEVDTVFETKSGDVGVEIFVQSRNNYRNYYGVVVENDTFHEAYEWLIKSVDRIQLTPSKDPLKFEMRIEYPQGQNIPKFPPRSSN